MITLLTASPGSGKTCYSIDYLRKAQAESRPIFQHGIKGLKIPSEQVFCSAQSCEICRASEVPEEQRLLAENWHEWAPTGAFIIFDEVQHVYRPRAQGKEPPPSVKAFETHRHRGLDFLLISQSPMLFDTNVRKLVTSHIHLEANWAKSKQYEWPRCVDNTANGRSDAVVTTYKMNKKNWDLYESAEMHTKVKRKIPPQLYIAIVVLVGAGIAAVTVASRVADRGNSVEVAEGAEVAPAASTTTTTGQLDIPNSPPGNPVTQEVASPFDREPLLAEYPESAPAYRHLVQVNDYPRIAACAFNPSKMTCNCYTQQATLVKTTFPQCLRFVENPPFDPYKVPRSSNRIDRGTGGSNSVD